MSKGCSRLAGVQQRDAARAVDVEVRPRERYGRDRPVLQPPCQLIQGREKRDVITLRQTYCTAQAVGKWLVGRRCTKHRTEAQL